MNAWKCPKCGQLNTPWVKERGRCSSEIATTCPDCARLKTLLGDVWRFAKPGSFDDPMDKFEAYKQLQARIKAEGIE